MNRKTIYFILIVFIGSMGLTFMGALAKLEHWEYSNTLLTMGIFSQIFIVGLTIILAIRYLISRKKTSET